AEKLIAKPLLVLSNDVSEEELKENVSALLDKIDWVERFSFDKDKVALSIKPVSVTSFITKINRAVSGNKRLSSKNLYAYLTRCGYVSEREVQVVKTVKEQIPTDMGAEIGLTVKEQVDAKTGEVSEKIILSHKAQSFIIENVENILTDSEEIVKTEVSNPIIDNAIAEIEENKKDVDYTPKVKPQRIGERWLPQEEMALVNEYTEKGYSIKQIAETHGRNPKGIRERLKRLGLVK
ncbi:MAG: hypothetical protein J6V69_03880, partial [Clostridia bacterium]|nr:hypothetical protein [Clostridia bacterium]